MSVIGTNTAIVSLGMSCQSAHQIRTHAKLISSYLKSGEILDASRLPFDWLICPPPSALKILESGTFFPEHPEALTLNHAPYWPEYSTYFWHDFLDDDRHYDLSLDFEGTKEKYKRLADKFRDLKRMARLVFVISNSQNNLEFVTERTQAHRADKWPRFSAPNDALIKKGSIGGFPKVDSTFGSDAPALTKEMSASHIEALCDATDKYFGRQCEYIVVTYSDRLDRDPDRDRVDVFRIDKDPSEWRGEPRSWAQVFAEYFQKWPDAQALP